MSVKKEIEITVNSKGAKKGVDEITESVNKSDQAANDLTASLDKMTGGAISAFKGVVSGVKKGVLAMKTLKTAIAATGIGLLVVAVGALTAAFTSSEEGQNKMAKIMGVIGSITGNLIDLFASLGNTIIDVFTKPKQVLTDLGNTIQTTVLDKVQAIREAFSLFGTAAKKVFGGDFKGAAVDAAKGMIQLNNELNPAILLTNSLGKATANLVKEMAKEAKIAANIADMRAKADKKERGLIVERAEADRTRAELLEKAVNKEMFSTQERIAFLEEAGKLEADITAKEIEAARLRYDAKVAENALAGSTKEDLDQEAELKARLIQLETAKLTKQKEVTGQVIALKNEELAAETAAQAEKDAADAEAEALRLEAIKAEQDARRQITEATLAAQDLELLKAREKYEGLIAEAEKYGIDTAALVTAQAEEINAINAKYDKEDSDRVKQKAADDKAIKEANLAAVAGALGSLSDLAGKEAATGKALSAAQAVINTYTGATKALAQGGIAGPIAAAGVIASGIASIRQIYATPLPTESGGDASSGSTPRLSTQAITPRLTLDTQVSDLGNQISRSLERSPVRAYVVNQDVQTANKMDRKIKQTATIG